MVHQQEKDPQRELFTLLRYFPMGGRCDFYDEKAVIDLIQRHPECCAVKGEISHCCTSRSLVYPLFMACRTPAPRRVFELLYEAYPDAILATDDAGRNCLQNALMGRAGRASPDIIEFMMEKNPDMVKQTDQGMRTSLSLACGSHTGVSFQIIRMLVQAYPEALRLFDGMGLLPLHWEASNLTSRLDVLRLFVETSPETATIPTSNEEGELALHRACGYGSFEAVKLLLDSAPETAAVASSKSGQLPLHNACHRQKHSGEMVKLLVDRFPEGVMAKDAEGRLPLHVAARPRNDISFFVVRYLVEQHPDGLREGTKAGETPLHLTLSYGASLPVVELFLSTTPEAVRRCDSKGRLPLHCACVPNGRNKVEAVKLLLQADPSTVGASDHEGLTPLHMAFSHRHSLPSVQLVKLLVRHGAVVPNKERPPLLSPERRRQLRKGKFSQELAELRELLMQSHQTEE